MSSNLVSIAAAQILQDEGNDMMVSAASAWEIATKVRLGKLPEAERLERAFFEVIEIAGYSLLPISVADGLRAGRMAGDHRDPFDRMIAAQAIADDLLVLSNDAKLDAFGVRRLW
jgi:PIN domain nuclease of toxin-antitoxin system